MNENQKDFRGGDSFDWGANCNGNPRYFGLTGNGVERQNQTRLYGYPENGWFCHGLGLRFINVGSPSIKDISRRLLRMFNLYVFSKTWGGSRVVHPEKCVLTERHYHD